MVEIADWFSKLTRAIPTAEINSAQVVTIFLDNWVIPYEIPSHVLTDSGLQLVSKFFTTLGPFLGVKKFTTTSHHQQTNVQVDRYNKTLVERLCCYVSDHQRDWDTYVQPLTYA